METSYINSGTDPLLLLKERIIKAEILLEKYACLTRKFNELEISHSQAVENEKKAKKDAIKYLEKYCKLTKKCDYLSIKIKTLEDSITEKTSELKKCQDEYARLESVLFMYKTERKGHQCLKKDKDFLLSALWKLLKRLEEDPREFKAKKLAENFFKRFERELMDLKLEDFRSSKIKNISKLTEKEKSDILFSPGSQVLDSVESDFIDTDIAPESVKSSLDEFDKNCIAEGINYAHKSHSAVDGDSCNNDTKTVDNLTSQTLQLDPYISKNSEEDLNSNLTDKNAIDTCEGINASGNNGSNSSYNQELENSSTDIYAINLSTFMNKTSESVAQSDGQEQNECCKRSLNFQDKFFPLESKDNIRVMKKMPAKFKKTYDGRKALASSQNLVILRKQLLDHHNLGNISCSPNEDNAAVNPIYNIKSVDIDCCNVSSEMVSSDMYVPVEDMGNVPGNNEDFKWIYDFFIASSHPGLLEKRTFINKDSPSLLFLMENELNFYADKTVIPESCKTVSVFDVEDNENSTPSRSVGNNDVSTISLEFPSDNFNVLDSIKESVNKVCEVDEEKRIFEQIEVSRKAGGENQMDKQLRNNSDSVSKGNNISSHSNQFFDNIKKKDQNLEFVQRHLEKSDDEVYRILKSFTIVPLLSPLKCKEENTKRTLFGRKSGKELYNLSQNTKTESNLNRMKSLEHILKNKCCDIEEKLLCISETGKNGKEKEIQMIDKVIQTDETDLPQEREIADKCNENMKRTCLSNNMMREICKRVWKRSLKKFKYINHFAKMLKSHSCLDFMKILLGMIDEPGLCYKNRKTEISGCLWQWNIRKNKTHVKSLKRTVSPWQVEDIETTNLISKNEPLCNYLNNETCSFFNRVPIHNYFQEEFNNSKINSEEIQRKKRKMSLNWFISDQEIGFSAPKTRKLEIYGSACECNFCWECGIRATGSSTFAKANKLDSFSVKDDENFEEKFTENINLNRAIGNSTITKENKLDSFSVKDDENFDEKFTENINLNRATRGSTITKANKLDSFSVKNDENFEERFTENINLNRATRGSTITKANKLDSFSVKNDENFEEKFTENINLNRATGNSTITKTNKLDSFSVKDDENFDGKFTENINVNNTYSLEDTETHKNSNFLDSIMTAMTKQTESFKVKTVLKLSKDNDTKDHTIRLAPQPSQLKNCLPNPVFHRKINQECRTKGDSSAFLNIPYYWNVDNQLYNRDVKEKTSRSNSNRNRQEDVKLKNLVQKEIAKFLKLDINTVEEGEDKIKSCVSVLEKASEDIIANVIVSEIMANVDEELKEFERPAPPLTQTQHRIMIILSVLSQSDEQFRRISNKILKIIWSKIFPENFFWPDDSLEMATRFYAALCKRLNNFKGIWKFCYEVIISMRQRWCIPIFVVLQVWPDIIHNANEIQDNLLVHTFVNVILHTPKSEELRRKRQEQKLLAIKHLLINFYNFHVNVTIEGFAEKLFESLNNDVSGSVDALVLLSKCRNWLWTRKNVVAKLIETLNSWLDGKVSDIIASKVLDILHKISPISPDESTADDSSALDLITTLKRLLSEGKADNVSEEKTIRILCSLCHYPDVKDTLSTLLGKFPCSHPLYSNITKALSSKKRKRKEGIRKADVKIKRKLRNKTKSKKKGKKEKKF